MSAKGAAALDAYKTRQRAARTDTAPARSQKPAKATVTSVPSKTQRNVSRVSKKTTVKGGKALGTLTHSDKIVTGGFAICGVLVLMQAFTGTDAAAGKKNEDWAHHLLVREIAVCVLFLILALLALAGGVAKQVASGLAILVTTGILVNSSELLTFANGVLDNMMTADSTSSGNGQTAAPPETAQRPANVGITPQQAKGLTKQQLIQSVNIGNSPPGF